MALFSELRGLGPLMLVETALFYELSEGRRTESGGHCPWTLATPWPSPAIVWPTDVSQTMSAPCSPPCAAHMSRAPDLPVHWLAWWQPPLL